ncbi:MAG: hypothetical protein IT289_10065 [Oligoflexia bacterium]|nr:hypothetical protein [Oligoflexia bacterium]
MKNVIVLLTMIAGLIPSFAQARYIGPYLVSVKSSGFVPPGREFSRKCEVYFDKVVITTVRWGVQVETKSNITVSSNLTDLIELADQARVTQAPGPVDVNTELYMAIKLLPNDATKKVDLGSRNGGSGVITKNESPSALALKGILDDLCKN